MTYVFKWLADIDTWTALKAVFIHPGTAILGLVFYYNWSHEILQARDWLIGLMGIQDWILLLGGAVILVISCMLIDRTHVIGAGEDD